MEILDFIFNFSMLLIAVLGRKAFIKLNTEILKSIRSSKFRIILPLSVLVLGLTFSFLVGLMSYTTFPNINVSLLAFLVLATGYVFSAYYTYTLINITPKTSA